MKLRKIAKIIGGLLALLIIAALALPMFVSAEYLKSQLVAQVKTATGRTLEIKGDASLKIFPNIAVKVEDVTLGNPPGFTGKYFAHVDKLETGAALGPLLSKELRITGIAVEGAVLNLEENASGAKNWEFANSKPATPEAAEQPKQAGEKPSPLKQLAIGDVTLKNSAVTMSKPGAKPMAVSDINLTLKGADGSAPLKIDGSAKYLNETVKLAVALEQSKAFLVGKNSPVELSATLPSGKISFKGSAINKTSISAEGTLTAAIDDLPKLMTWATGKPAGAGLPKKIALNSGLFMQNDKAFALKNATLVADALQTSGSLAINLAGAVPDIRGNLKFDMLDLNALPGSKPASGSAGSGAKSAPAAKSEGWSDAPFDVSGLRAANAALKLSIGQLKTGNVAVSDIATDIALNGGKLKLTLDSAKLYGGSAKGNVSLDGSGAGLGLGTSLTLSGIDIDALMTALSGASKLKGTATLSLNLSGAGGSERALVSNLDGSGHVRINDGAIKGINIASFLRDAKKGFVLGNSTAESTDFTELTASYKIANGIVSSDDLFMKSPILRLTGKGTVSLPQRSINYRAVPEVVASMKGQGGKDKLGTGLAVPLLITGPWSAISVTPDVAGLLQEGLKNPEALKQNLKDIKENLRDFNSPKDIGKALLGGGKKEAAPAAPATTATPEAAPAAAPTTDAQPTAAPVPKTKEEKIQEGIGGLLKGLGK